MRHEVFWRARRPPAQGRELAGELRADVAVVGGGVAGLSCAQRLHEAGLSVVLVERDFCGAGASGLSSGFVTPASEIELSSLIASYGAQEAKRIWEFTSAGVEAIRANVLEHALDCEYQVQDSLFVGNGARGREAVESEHRARVELGYASRFYDGPSVREALATSSYSSAVRFGPTFAVDSYAYSQEMRARLAARGVSICEHSAVTEIRADGVRTERGFVRAKHVVVCADRFTPELGAFEREVYHVLTFLAVSAPLPPSDLARVFTAEPAMTWDSDLVYSYFRAVGRDRLLLGGGDLLHTYARSAPRDLGHFAKRARREFLARFPGVELEIEFAWSGMLGVSKDLLPVMGQSGENSNVWYAGAATGLPWAASLGIYAADRIVRGRSDFDSAFSPDRKFAIGRRLQSLLSTPVSFAISNKIAKQR
jgi:gamma-glutamylputrescine oxidase